MDMDEVTVVLFGFLLWLSDMRGISKQTKVIDNCELRVQEDGGENIT
jgi:hypothetical protein